MLIHVLRDINLSGETSHAPMSAKPKGRYVPDNGANCNALATSMHVLIY